MPPITGILTCSFPFTATGTAQGTEIYCCRGVKEADFYVLKNTACPAVLVETVFIDNPNDAKLLIEPEDDDCPRHFRLLRIKKPLPKLEGAFLQSD